MFRVLSSIFMLKKKNLWSNFYINQKSIICFCSLLFVKVQFYTEINVNHILFYKFILQIFWPFPKISWFVRILTFTYINLYGHTGLQKPMKYLICKSIAFLCGKYEPWKEAVKPKCAVKPNKRSKTQNIKNISKAVFQ